MDKRRRDGTHEEAGLQAPPDLRAAHFQVRGASVVVMTFPLAGTDVAFVEHLTHAERAVARAVLAGATYDAIATGRGTSRRTVRNLVTSIFKKLGVTSRVGLVALLSARRRGATC